MIPVGSPALQLLLAEGSSSWLAVGRIYLVGKFQLDVKSF